MSRANAIPLWRQRVSFEHGLELESLDDAHWRAFSFELPDGLPPAVEARSIAWRYEVEARRSVRIGPDDRALITPLASVNVLANRPSCGSLGDPHEGAQLSARASSDRDSARSPSRAPARGTRPTRRASRR